MNKVLTLICNADRVFRPESVNYVIVKNYKVVVDDAMWSAIKALRAKRGDAKYPDECKKFVANHDCVPFTADDDSTMYWLTAGDAC